MKVLYFPPRSRCKAYDGFSFFSMCIFAWIHLTVSDSMELVNVKKFEFWSASCMFDLVSTISNMFWRWCIWRAVVRTSRGMDWGVIMSAKTRLSFKFDLGAVDGWIISSLTRWTLSLGAFHVVHMLLFFIGIKKIRRCCLMWWLIFSCQASQCFLCDQIWSHQFSFQLLFQAPIWIINFFRQLCCWYSSFQSVLREMW